GPRAVKDYAETFRRLCTGQLLETVGRTPGVSPRVHYLEVLAGKTGSLIAASAREGVYAAAGSREAEYAHVAAQVQEFGENVGIAFQIADDYIDVVSEETGKEQGT
ncbi:polyprenyl synthetase family protein, partial [Streptococcus anginosus]|nr:polyprenyl synthetase family protein [Streptococcus anginosus]